MEVQSKVGDLSVEQVVAVGILCALKVYKEENFVKWANNWLTGEDRSYETALTASDRIYSDNEGHGPDITSASYAADAAKAKSNSVKLKWAISSIGYALSYANTYEIHIDLDDVVEKAKKLVKS